MRELSQAKRSHNREQSAALLENSGIEFERKNDGAHLIILSNPKIDFYPGTGLWRVRGENKSHRGVRHLLKHLGK
nr:MAG TPA: hypothetical protein [Caudoviricetes sp.]